MKIIFLPTKLSKKYLAKLFITVFLISQLTFAATVAKIDNKSISLKELQNYLEVQMFLADEDNKDTFFTKKNIDSDDLLQEYLTHLLLLDATVQYKIGPNSKKIKDKVSENKHEWIANLYLSRAIDLFSIEINEKIVRGELTQQVNIKKKYKDLTSNELRNLQQLAFLKISKTRKDDLRKKLIKKHNAKVNKITDKIVFTIGNKKYSQANFNNFLTDQLDKVGISEEQLRKQAPERFATISDDFLKEMILQELIKLEIAKTKFEQSPSVKKALLFFNEQIAIDTFINEIIAAKIKITDNEMDVEFKNISKKSPAIQKMLPSQQEAYLKRYIIEKKLPLVLKSFVESRREESKIKRFSKVLTDL